MQLNCSINIEALQKLIAYLNNSNEDLDVVLADVASQITDKNTREAYITLILAYLKKDNPANDVIQDITYTNHSVSKHTTNPNYRKELSLEAHKLVILDELNKQHNDTTPEKEAFIDKINNVRSKKDLMDIHIALTQVSPSIQSIIQATEEEEEVLSISEQRLQLLKHIKEKKQEKEDLAKQITELEEIVGSILKAIGESKSEFNRLVELVVSQETVTDEEIRIANEEKSPDTTVKEHIHISFREYLRNKYKGGLKGLFKRIKDKLRKILLVINLASIMTLHVTKDINLSNYRNDIKTKYEKELNIQLNLDTTIYKHGFEYKQTNNYRVDSLGNKIDNKPSVIVLHHTGEYKNGLRSVFNEFAVDGGNSSHFVIGKNGKVYQFNNGSYILFHAGKSIFNGVEDVNSYSIGIEMEGDSNLSDITKEQYESLVLLLHDLAKTYNIPIDNITSHAAIRNAYLKAHPEDKETQGKADLSEEVFSKVIKAIQANYPKQQVIEAEEEQDSTPISNTLKIIAALQALDIAIRAYRRRKTNSLVVDEEKEVSNSKIEEAMDTIEKDKIIAIIEELRKSLIEQQEELAKLRNQDETYDEEILFLQEALDNLVEEQIIEPIIEETIINIDDTETPITPPVIIPLTENKPEQKRRTVQEMIRDLKIELENATKETDKDRLQKRIVELENKLYSTKINTLKRVLNNLEKDSSNINFLISSSKLTKKQQNKLQRYKDTIKDIIENNDVELLSKLSSDALLTLYSFDNKFRYGDSGIVTEIEDLDINSKWLAIFTKTNNTIEIEKLNERLKRSTKKTDWTVNSWNIKAEELVTDKRIKEINAANTSFNKKLNLILNTVPIEDVVLVEENTPIDENTILVRVSEKDIANKKAALEKVVNQLERIKDYGVTFGKALLAIEDKLREEKDNITREELTVLRNEINNVWVKNPDDKYDVIAERINNVRNKNTSELSRYTNDKKQITITPIDKNGITASNVVVMELRNKEVVYYYTDSRLVLKDNGIERHLYYTDDNNPIDVNRINDETQKGKKIVVDKDGNFSIYFATVDTNNEIVYKTDTKLTIKYKPTVSNIVNYSNLVVNAHNLPTINNKDLATKYTTEELSRAINDLYAFRDKSDNEYKTKLYNYINSNWNNPINLIALRDKLVKGLNIQYIPTEYDIEYEENGKLIIYNKDGEVVFLNGKVEVVDEATYELIKREKQDNNKLIRGNNLESVKHPYIYNNINNKSKQELVSEYRETIDKLTKINNQKDLKEQTITVNTALSDTEVERLLLELANKYTIHIGDELYTNNADMTKYNNIEEKQLRFTPIVEIIPENIEIYEKDAIRETLTPILNSPAVPLADNQRDYVNEGDNLLYDTDYYDSNLQMTVKFPQNYNDNYRNGLIEKLTSDITDTQVQIYMPIIESITLPANEIVLQKEINELLVEYNTASTNEEKFDIYKNIIKKRIESLIAKNNNYGTVLLEKGYYSAYNSRYPTTKDDFLFDIYPSMLVPLTYRNTANGNIYGTVHTYEYILNPHKFVQKISNKDNPAVTKILEELREIRSNSSDVYKNIYRLKTYFNEETESNTGYPLIFANNGHREVNRAFNNNNEVLSIRKKGGVWYIDNYTHQEYKNSEADTAKEEAITKLIERLEGISENIPDTTTYYIMPVKINTLISKTTNLAPYYIYNVYTKKFKEYSEDDKKLLELDGVNKDNSLANIAEKLKFFKLRRVRNIDDEHDFDNTPLIYKYSYYNDTQTAIYFIKYRVNNNGYISDKQVTIEVVNGKPKYKINNTTYYSELKDIVKVKEEILAILEDTRIYVDSTIAGIHYNKNNLFVTNINGTNISNNINMVFVNPTYITQIIDNTTIEPHIEKTEVAIMDSKTIDNTPVPTKRITKTDLVNRVGEDNLQDITGDTFEYTNDLEQALEDFNNAWNNGEEIEALDFLKEIKTLLKALNLTPDCAI